jgi:hypothetical protein
MIAGATPHAARKYRRVEENAPPALQISEQMALVTSFGWS